jgi:hypothetical protein
MPSTTDCTKQDIVRLRRFLATSGSSLTGTAASVAGTSTQSGTSSFHMSPDSSALSSLRPLSLPVNVLTADGTSLHVASRGTLSTSFFFVPDVSHVPLPLKLGLGSPFPIG